MPHIIIFKDADFFGDHKHIFQSRDNLKTIDGGFNDTISSFYIVDGYWQFFKDWEWQTPFPLGQSTPVVLGPGPYWSVTEALGPGSNDSITGLRLVELENGVWVPVTITAPPPVNIAIKEMHASAAHAR